MTLSLSLNGNYGNLGDIPFGTGIIEGTATQTVTLTSNQGGNASFIATLRPTDSPAVISGVQRDSLSGSFPTGSGQSYVLTWGANFANAARGRKDFTFTVVGDNGVNYGSFSFYVTVV